MQKSNGKRGRGKVVNNPLTKNTGNAKRERRDKSDKIQHNQNETKLQQNKQYQNQKEEQP